VQRVGLAVRAGAKKPDIATDDALRKTLVDAKSIGHSIGPSGDHFSKVIIARLGIAEQLEPKITVVRGIPVAAAVAKGDAEIGIHEIIELMPIPGIDIVGVLPADLDKTTSGEPAKRHSLGSGVSSAFRAGVPDTGGTIVTALSTRTSARVFSSRTSRLMFSTVSQAW
jgi:hypothetical protein